jgi:hypothetical protein
VLLIAFDAQTSLFTALVSICNSLTCGQQHVQTPIISSVVITLGGSSSGSSSSSSVLPVAAGGPTYRVSSKQQCVPGVDSTSGYDVIGFAVVFVAAVCMVRQRAGDTSWRLTPYHL